MLVQHKSKCIHRKLVLDHFMHAKFILKQRKTSTMMDIFYDHENTDMYYLWSWSLISQPKKIISFTVCSKMAWKVNPIMSAMGIWKRRIMKKQKSLCPASLRHCLLPSYLTSTSSICKSQYDHAIHMPYRKKKHWMLHNYFETFKKKQMAILILKGK